ncbi:MAG: hypothetical protein KDA96_06485 [Planctomycetaceae bacterium]|nr:hypothetical protein [Planctomycetaceae bacterium]
MSVPGAGLPDFPHRGALRARNGWPEFLWYSAFLLLGLAAMSNSIADPDLWGHVQYGHEVLRDGHLHSTTTWSYAVQDYRWINHEIIAELVLAWVHDQGGQTGLLILKAVMGILLLAIPLKVAVRESSSRLSALAVIILVSFMTAFHWHLRPHMFSYLCAACLLAILTLCVPGVVRSRSTVPVNPRLMWLLPPLMTLWTNSHGGFLAGLAILMAWLGLDALDLIITRHPRTLQSLRNHSIVLSASGAATLLNPYGSGLHRWMLSSLGRPRPEISDWMPLDLVSRNAIPFWMLVMMVIVCICSSRAEWRWPGSVIAALLAWQALSHCRHVPFLSLFCVFWLTPHFDSCVRNFAQRGRQRLDLMETQVSPATEVREPGWLQTVVPPVLLMVICSVILLPQMATLRVDREAYPVDAMQFMADHRLSGNTLVTFNWAQYAIHVFAETSPQSRVAIDGRFRTCYPQQTIDTYFDFLLGDPAEQPRYREDASGPFDPDRALEERAPDLVLIEDELRPAILTLQRNADDWVLLYRDQTAQLWGRRDRYDNPGSPFWLPPQQRQIQAGRTSASADYEASFAAWPAVPHVRS